jgi:uncharacterized coiled-coil DUF342 family protein
MHPAGSINNEMLYELIRDFKSDVNRRFDEVDKRFVQNERQFDEIRDELKEIRIELKEIRNDMKSDKTRLDKLCDSRDTVRITFSRLLFGINVTLSAIVAAIISYVR